jgi:hypothetical protein
MPSNDSGRSSRPLAVLVVVLLILATVTAVLAVNFERVFLNAGVYKNALAGQKFYDRLPGVVAGQLIAVLNFNPCTANPLLCSGVNQAVLDCARSALGNDRFGVLSSTDARPTNRERSRLENCVSQFQPGLQQAGSGTTPAPLLFRSMKVQDLETVIRAALSPDKMELQVEGSIDSLFAYLNGQQENFNLSLVPLKQGLSSPAGLDAVLGIIRAQPPCTIEQLEAMLVVSLTGKGDLVLCSPPESLLGALAPLIQAQLQFVVSLLPDSLVLHPFGNLPATTVRLVRLLLLLSPELALFLLILVTLLAVRTFKEMLYWWGMPLFFSGLLALVVGISASLLFEWGWANIFISHLSIKVSDALIVLLHDLLQAVMQTYLSGVFISGIVLALAGACLWVGSKMLKGTAGSE